MYSPRVDGAGRGEKVVFDSQKLSLTDVCDPIFGCWELTKGLLEDQGLIRKMQIKPTLRFHLTHVWRAKSKKTDDILCWRGCGVRGMVLHCWWECNPFTAALKISMGISQKISKLFTSRHSNTTFWYIPKECSIIPQGHVLYNVQSSTICHSQNLETT